MLGTTRSTVCSVERRLETALRDLRNQLRRLRRSRNRHPRTPGGRSLVLGAAEAEDREENKRQQKQTNPKAHSFPETLREVDEKNDRDYEIHQRN